MSLRVVGWNVRQGGGPRCPRIAAALVSLETDVAVLSEYRHTGSGDLSGLLADHGFIHQVPRADPVGGYAGLLVASRTELVDGGTRYNSTMDGHRFAHLLVGQWNICGAYIPAAEPPLSRKREFWRFLLDDVDGDLRASSAVVIGDLNTGLHYRDEPGATFACAEEMAAFEARGWFDGWTRHHRRERPPATWWNPQPRTQFRLDHALFSPASTAQVRVTYPESIAELGPVLGAGGLSDHLPVVVDLPT